MYSIQNIQEIDWHQMQQMVAVSSLVAVYTYGLCSISMWRYLYICVCVSPYKILFHFKALLWESLILLLPRSPCKAYPVAILLHANCAIYAPPPTPPCVAYTIQYW